MKVATCLDGRKHESDTIMTTNGDLNRIYTCPTCWDLLTLPERLELTRKFYKKHPGLLVPWEQAAARIWAGGVP